jgi:hypothetical protein
VDFSDLSQATRTWLYQNRSSITNIDNLCSRTTITIYTTNEIFVCAKSGPWTWRTDVGSTGGSLDAWYWPDSRCNSAGTAASGWSLISGSTPSVLYRR